MTDHSSLFFQLLQISIEKRRQFNSTITQNEWAELFAMAKKQSLAGICFTGVEKLPKEQSPGEDLIMDWMGEAVKIQRRNQKLNEACQELNLCGDVRTKEC
jgi:hypothetical protein